MHIGAVFMIGGNKVLSDHIYLNKAQICDIHNDKWSVWYFQFNVHYAKQYHVCRWWKKKMVEWPNE